MKVVQVAQFTKALTQESEELLRINVPRLTVTRNSFSEKVSLGIV